VIKSSDVFPEREDQVMSVIQEVLKRTCRLWFGFKIGTIQGNDCDVLWWNMFDIDV
jgi:hypothetical protein